MAIKKAEQPVNKISELVSHLLHYGELSPAEAAALNGGQAATLLEQDGWLARRGEGWVVAGRLLAQLPVANTTGLVRRVCFSHPGYRRYLTTLAAAELTRRGLEGAMEQVEQWAAQETPHLAGEINRLLDRLERDHLHKPLKQCAPGVALPGFTAMLAGVERPAGFDPAAWDKALLGVSGDREAVFQAILARRALEPVSSHPAAPAWTVPEQPLNGLNEDLARPQNRPVFFPPLDRPAETEAGLVLADGPLWARRRYVYSSLAWPDDGPVAPPHEDETAWQETFSRHPISWLLIQLGLYRHVQRASGGGLAYLRLTGAPDEARGLSDLRLSLDEQPVGGFLALLPELLAILGWRLALPFGRVSPLAFDRLAALMRQARIFTETPQGEYILTDSFTRTLFERPRYRRLNKGVKPYRERLIRKLEDILSRQMKREESYADAKL